MKIKLRNVMKTNETYNEVIKFYTMIIPIWDFWKNSGIAERKNKWSEKSIFIEIILVMNMRKLEQSANLTLKQ